MSIKGVRQLTGLTLRYCDLGGERRQLPSLAVVLKLIPVQGTPRTTLHVDTFLAGRAGSSRGARAFIQQELVKWAVAHPAVQIDTVVKRNHHPVVTGSYGESTLLRVWRDLGKHSAEIELPLHRLLPGLSVWGMSKTINVENVDIAGVMKEFQRLRNS
jgi:hypothetical protein